MPDIVVVLVPWTMLVRLYLGTGFRFAQVVVTSRPFDSTNRPADFKPLTATVSTHSKPASEPAHESAPNSKSATHAEGKVAPARKPAPEKAPGLCAELRAIVEGSTVEEILAKARILIAGSATRSALSKPRITVRISPLLADK